MTRRLRWAVLAALPLAGFLAGCRDQDHTNSPKGNNDKIVIVTSRERPLGEPNAAGGGPAKPNPTGSTAPKK